jgi:hypothetical protein
MKRIILGLLTLMPVVLPFIALIPVAAAPFGASHVLPKDRAEVLAEGIAEAIPAFIAVFALSALIAIVVLAIYLVHVIKNPTLKTEWKAVWMLAIFFLSIPAMLIYLLLYMGKPAPAAT